MKAIILAAGKATRLLPLTKETPQSLLKIRNKTILEMQLNSLNKSGIKDVVAVTGYLADKIENFSKGKSIRVLFNPFYSVSGMLMTLWVAKEELRNGFIVLYSDVLFEESIINKLMNDKHDICLTIKKDGVREEAEKVKDENGVAIKISKIEDKKEANAEFIGIAKFSKNGAEVLIDVMDEIAKSNINAQFIDAIQLLIDKGKNVYTCDVGKAKYIDIDFEKDLKQAEEMFSKIGDL